MCAGMRHVRASVSLGSPVFRRVAAISFALAACNEPAPPNPVAPRPPLIAPIPTSSAAIPPPSASSSAAAAPPPPSLEVKLVREVDAPVFALALETPPLAAALGASEAWIHDASGWKKEPLPASATQEPLPRLAIFYGRDDRVRVVGTRVSDRGNESVYLRYKPQGFIPGTSEIGKLGDLKGGLVAVLGTKDPEIVCRPGDICFVKRRTGWKMIPAPADIERVVLGDDVGWGLGGQTLYRLDETLRPESERGTWQRAGDLFALRDRAFVIETEPARIHAFDGARWQVSPSPIEHPRAMWGTSPSALWLVGDGIAFFDGASWRVAADPHGPFSAVLGRNADDVWIGGPSGVYRVTR